MSQAAPAPPARLGKFFAKAKTDCCNYSALAQGVADYCWLTGKPCLLRDDRFCKWFDEAVIAYKPFRVQGLYRQWREMWEGTPDRIVTRTCCNCGEEYRPTSPRQKFCVRCGSLNLTERDR